MASHTSTKGVLSVRVRPWVTMGSGGSFEEEDVKEAGERVDEAVLSESQTSISTQRQPLVMTLVYAVGELTPRS